ncbi:pantothenate synthetase [Sideroxyarcus emersonii]|uniref:Pantothenate synthetase n=1 Tax=Sideroxyarcus emersonii TaxID=2764705 RepID=A0AAN1X966_9PROT|nr:pantoate--beta-alanine ligase [Sideroxyarcus emersonii]BCK87120.1 pantothenate synthetase [Sideroxyarcus emersonii]
MQLVHSVAELRARLAGEQSVAFVPTMGNLHEGHLELVRIARRHGSCVVVSIFVNPLQFGPNEDFDKYPRTLEADCAKLQGLADVVFAPMVGEMYPEKQTVFVEPPPIASELCGAFRPGHFLGVATVVLKLFNLVQPQIAIFGKKDYQQLAIIRQMVIQLNLPITIIGAETARAADGLALSSRNQYLSAEERTEAAFLSQTLRGMGVALKAGKAGYADLEEKAGAALAKRGWQVEYVAVRRQADLGVPGEGERNLVILAAARLGKTRLIDNIEVGL